MRRIFFSFRALYFATLLMLTGSGLLSTYLALRLAADKVDGLWVGALMAANYFGLVLGGSATSAPTSPAPGWSPPRSSAMACCPGCRRGSPCAW